MARKDDDIQVLEDIERLSQAAGEHEKLEMLQRLGIYELRGLAREVGVKSPTTKRRAELIKCIIENSQGKKEILPNLQGRRPKEISKVRELYDTFMNISRQAPMITNKNFDYGSVVMFGQNLPILEDSNEDFFVRGVFRNCESPYFIDMSNSQVIVGIDKSLVDQYNLENGQILRGYANKISGNNNFKLRKLESIDGVPVKTYEKPVKKQLEEVAPTKIIELGARTLKEGGIFRHGFESFNYIAEVKEACDVMNELSDKGFKVVFVGCSMNNDSRFFLENNAHGEKFISRFDDSPDISFNKIIDAISYVRNQSADGRKIFVYLHDIVSVLSQLDLHFANNENANVNGHNAEAVVIIRALLSIAKAYKDGSSTTVYATYHESEGKDEVIINTLFKASEKC